MSAHHERPTVVHDGGASFPYRWVIPLDQTTASREATLAAACGAWAASVELGMSQPPTIVWFELSPMRGRMHFTRPHLISGCYDEREPGTIHIRTGLTPGAAFCAALHEAHHAAHAGGSEAAAESFAARLCRAAGNRCERHGPNNAGPSFFMMARRLQLESAARSTSAPAARPTASARPTAFMSTAGLHGPALRRALETAVASGWPVDLGDGRLTSAREALKALPAPKPVGAETVWLQRLRLGGQPLAILPDYLVRWLARQV
ncbi:MAG: hypothetical protein IT301_17310 [Dehalococcoidia bacterium]|nr:hypothetical protein [Dehalococcoidia bacterium]